MIPSWKRKEVYFTSVNKEIDVILQVSNFQHRKGGPEDVMLFGPAKNVITYKNQQLAIGLFLFGILMIMSIYHLVLYLYRRKDKSIILFSAVCFLLTLRLITTGEKILIEVFPNINWAFAVRIEYISYKLAVPLFLAFIHSIFPKDIPYRLVKYVGYFALFFVAIVIFTPVSIFSYTPVVYQFFLAIVALYVLIVLVITMLKRREYSWILFGGYFFFFLVVINDILYYNKFLETSFLGPFGLFVMVFTQAFVLSKKTSIAFNEVERLTVQLDNYSRELEETVKQRTNEIVGQKEKIEKQKEEIESQADNLKIANEQLIEMDKFKESMTNMMVHDLKNPLSTIIGFSTAEMSGKYLNYIHQSGKQMLQLVSNILDVQKYEKTEMKLNKIKEFLHDIANSAFNQVKHQLVKKDIEFQNLIPKDHVVNVDEEIIKRVFMNIFSNAIKYISQTGIIKTASELIVEEKNEYFRITIYNSGESIPADKIDTIFESYGQVNPIKSGISYSTGIGLAFCKLAIQSHNGKIGAESDAEQGVTIWFTLEG